MRKLKNLKIVIVSHVFATGPAQELENYLVKKQIKDLTFLGFPFSYCKVKNPFLKKYQSGCLIKEKIYPVLSLPGSLFHFKDIFLTIWIVLTKSFKADLYIGADCLNAFSGLVLKKLGIVKKVVFYTIDYVPTRFSNKLLNNFYHWIDFCCVKNCDQTWNLAVEMAKGREAKGLPLKYGSRQVTVPIGVSDIKKVEFKDIERYTIAFMGHLTAGKGIETLIDSMPDILSKISDTRLLIIGSGEMEASLKELVRRKKLDKSIEFTGYLENHDEVIDKLSKCAIAIAPYRDSKDTYTRYADPGKIKAYLAAGLPVVVTNVPKIAEVIDKAGCGIAIQDKKETLVDSIYKLLSDEDLLRKYRLNTVNFIKNYTWDAIYQKAFTSLYKDLGGMIWNI